MGLPKIGKSTAMSKLPHALICDLEGKGYDGIDVAALARTTTLDELKKACIWFFSSQNTTFEVLVIDHIRVLTSFFSSDIARENGTRFVEEVEFGKGTAHLRKNIDSFLKWLNAMLAATPDRYVILVAHAIDRNSEVRLDVDGKNETMILSLVDAVGFIDRENGQTMVDFHARRGVEFGARNSALAAYDGVLDWSLLFKIAEGKEIAPAS